MDGLDRAGLSAKELMQEVQFFISPRRGGAKEAKSQFLLLHIAIGIAGTHIAISVIRVISD